MTVYLGYQADLDLLAILEHIAEDSPASAQRVGGQITDRFALLGRHPETGERCPGKLSAYRRTIVGAYVVYYRLDTNAIKVVRILHGARDHGPLLDEEGSSTMMRYVVLVVALASPWSFSRAIMAADPPSEAGIKALIDQLASPNPVPQAYDFLPQSNGAADESVERGTGAVYPTGYDHDAQRVVMSALFRLRDLGPSAFPQLLVHTNDRRYSFTHAPDEVDYNWSVGAACRDLLRSQLQAFSNSVDVAKGIGPYRSRKRRPGYFNVLQLHESDRSQTWWKPRQAKSLVELQIEALEWTIAEEAKTPQDYSAEEREYLQTMLTKLRASQQPLKPYPLWAP